MAAFEKGDKVAWSHGYAVQHAEGSIVGRDVVEALAPDASFGVVKKIANDEGTWFEVQLDGSKDTVVLTQDELVKVAGDA